MTSRHPAEERALKVSALPQTVEDVLSTTRERGALVANSGFVPFPSADSVERARSLVLRHGWNATAYQLLNPGIELWFARAGDAVVGFVRHGNTRVVAGAPVCAIERLPDVAEEFLAATHDLNERVCYFGAGQRLEELYADAPEWSRVLLGGQPVWNPHQWSSRIAPHRSLRAQFNRARNKGVTVREWTAGEAENSPALRRCLVEWLGTRHLPTLHFLVEPETLTRLQDRRVFVATRGAREVVGFTVLSPVAARNGWLVEQIVRGHQAPNGTAELLIDTAMRAVDANGATYVTLGLSPLSARHGVDGTPQPMWLDLALRWVRVHGKRFYNFEGLESFKAKFDPEEWEPIFAIADSPRFPPRALYAIAGAFSAGNPILLIVRAILRAGREEIGKLVGRVKPESPLTRRHERRQT